MSEIVERFAGIVRDSPRRPLIVLPALERAMTAADIWSGHQHNIRALRAIGLSPGDLVICAIGNRPEFVPFLLACRALDLAVMAVDTGTTAAETGILCSRFGAKALIASGLAAPTHSEVVVLTPDLVLTRCAVPPSAYPGVAMLKLTSGSSGPPKATRTTESQLVADGEQILATMGIGAADTQLATIPLSHSYGLGVIVLPLMLQGTPMVLRDSFIPQQLAADAKRFVVRCFPGVPFMFDHLLLHGAAAPLPRGLRLLVSAGARLGPATQQAFHARFGAKIHTFYGTTETGGISFDDSDSLDEGLTVGRPLAGVSVSLRVEDGLPAGTGRVCVESPAVADGYVGGDSADFDGRSFLTGDYGSLGNDGRLTLEGRLSAFINVAGRKVQPDEVEAVVRAFPAVLDARVVAGPDGQRGQQVVAIVTPRPGLPVPTLMDIRQFCSTRLAAHKLPRRVVVVDAIPLTSRGKTDRRALADLVAVALEP